MYTLGRFHGLLETFLFAVDEGSQKHNTRMQHAAPCIACGSRGYSGRVLLSDVPSPPHVGLCPTTTESRLRLTRSCARAHTRPESERASEERERRGGGRERARERDRARVSVFKGVLLITLLAPVKHTPTYPASSAPDTRCRRALPKPCNVGPDAAAPPPPPRRHRTPPNARHPRPHDPGPRTPPPQRPRAPARHRTAPRPTAHKLGPGKTRPAGERPRHSRARRIRADRTTSGPVADHRVRAWPPAPAAHARRAPPFRRPPCSHFLDLPQMSDWRDGCQVLLRNISTQIDLTLEDARRRSTGSSHSKAEPRT